MRFNTSWDWLMPVVEKIEKLNNSNEDYYTNCFEDVFFSTNIQNTYQAVIEFITWYSLKNS